jgi:predicted PurR-regulated permease PerM
VGPGTGTDHDLRATSREALVFWAVGAVVAGVLLVLHVAAQVLLLTFAGLLLGTTLRGAAEWLAAHARLKIGWSLALCVIVLLALIGIAMLWIVPQVDRQAAELWQKLLQAGTDIQEQVRRTAIGRQVLVQSFQVGAWLAGHAGLAANILIATLGVLGAGAYLLFVALYFAVSPRTYRGGVLALVPHIHVERAGQILDALGSALRRWLYARLISMTVLGIGSSIGLWLLGIPLALTLGLLAGGLLFVPYLGSITAAIPALLIALTVGPMHVVYVALLYIGIHLADGYLLDPALQRRAVRLPPLVVLAGQLVFGELWGILGFALATPLVACLLVLVRMLYVENLAAGAKAATRDQLGA